MFLLGILLGIIVGANIAVILYSCILISKKQKTKSIKVKV